MTLALAGSGGAPPIPGLSSDGSNGIFVGGNVGSFSQSVFGNSAISGQSAIGGDEVVDGKSFLGANARAELFLIHPYTHAEGEFDTPGDAQYDRYLKFLVTTDASPTKFVLPSDDHTMNMSPRVAEIVLIELVALSVTDLNVSAGWVIRSLLRSVNGPAVPIGTPEIVSWADLGASTWTATLASDGGGVSVIVTGEALKTIRWVGTIHRTIVRRP